MNDDAASDASGRGRRRGVSLATRLATAAVGVSFAALVAAIVVGLTTGLDLGRDIYQDRLVSLGNAGADNMSAAISTTSRSVGSLALSPATAAAVSEFATAFDALEPPADFDVADERRRLIEAYRTIYESEVALAATAVSPQSVITRAPNAIYLQSLYSVDEDVERQAAIENADDGSEWSAVHARYQASFRRFVDELQLVDLYLVEPRQGRIVYSVEKRADLGTSLSAGPYSGSLLANTVLSVIDDGQEDAITDLGFYDGVPGRVVGAYAVPIRENGSLVGVLAVLTDGAVVTELMTNGGDWDSAGFDETTDQYLVGSDGTVRSEPRAYLEEPQAFLDAAQAAGNLTETERSRIENLGTTVLTLRAVDATLAVDERSDPVAEGRAIDGTEVFSNVTEVGTTDLDEALAWTAVTEIETVEARTALDDFRDVLVVGTAVFLIVAAFVAVAWANRTMAPVRTISDRLADPDALDAPLQIREESPLEFHYLAASFSRMVATLRTQHRQLATAREEWLQLMQQMLPPAVVERVTAGDLDELDEVPQTSVAVVVVLGLGDLVQREGPEGRVVVEELLGELDSLAQQHGLDRIKIVGDAYFASCGHDRPYIDHAPRAVAFAADARDAVEEYGRRTSEGLDAAIGVHTGPVTIGMVGEDRMIFDVWGDTVSYAHLLARRAHGGDLLVSDRTHTMLPDEMVTERADDVDDTVWSVPFTTVGETR